MFIDSHMKRLVRILAVGLLVAAAVMTVIYRAVNRVPSSELPLNEQVYEIFTDGSAGDDWSASNFTFL